MKVLLISNLDQPALEAQIRARGSTLFQVSPGAIGTALRFLSADVIVLDLFLEDTYEQVPDVMRSLELAGFVRKLPDRWAMDDGRKWSRIPIVKKTIAADFFEKDFLPQIPDANCHEIGFGPDISKPYRAMRKLAWNYYERLADDYDNIGVIMEDDGRGRLKAKTALRRRRDENTTYYYGPSDARRSNIFTLARDMEGDANDLADFNDIVAINAHSTEPKIHHFLADTTELLTVAPVAVISHPRIGQGRGSSEMDFVFRPYLNRDAAQSWSLYEIKRADQSVMADLGRGNPRLTAAVFRAIEQVRNYKRKIEDPRYRREVVEAIGDIPNDANLAVLIGRRPRGHKKTLAGC